MKETNKSKANKRKKTKKKQHHSWQKLLKIIGLAVATALAALAVIARAYHFFFIHVK